MNDIESLLKKSRLVSGLKKRAPFLYKAAFSAYFRLKALVDLPRYGFCRATGAAYFGPVMLGAQTWASRDPHMRAALALSLASAREESGGDSRVLEIGSWAGQSAILWASELSRAARPGKVFCVDPWMPFLRQEHIGDNTAVTLMDRVARRDRIFPRFWHNVKAAGFADAIVPLRGFSRDILPLLQPRSFDLVFVDGSHAFSDFFADLTLAAPLVKEAGIICGDDLESQLDEVDPAFTEENREKDFVADPKTGRDYHPGVTLGAARFFGGRVSCRDGFWLMRKSGGRWENVELG